MYVPGADEGSSVVVKSYPWKAPLRLMAQLVVWQAGVKVHESVHVSDTDQLMLDELVTL